jgi:hypothetical protein
MGATAYALAPTALTFFNPQPARAAANTLHADEASDFVFTQPIDR